MNMIFTNNLQRRILTPYNNTQINTKDNGIKTRDLFGGDGGFKQSIFYGNFITRINTNNQSCSSCSGYK
jgi:hypothetical protein